MICLACRRTIPALPTVGYENSAVVFQDYAGYGSRFDTSGFRLVVCDDCIEREVHSQVIEKLPGAEGES